MTYETIVEFVRTHDDPCVTAGEIADAFDVTNEAAHYRLKRLKEREQLEDKKVGASAKVWYPVG
jgi:predicted ArsR family transcriptional regulator